MSVRIVQRGLLPALMLGAAVSGASAQALPGAPQALAPAPVLSKLDPLMQARVWYVSERSKVIVRAVDAARLPEGTLLIEQTGGVAGRALPILQAIAADIPNASLAALTNSPLVRRHAAR